MANADFGLLILRLAGGGFMLTHGLDKFQNFSQYVAQFPGMFGMSPSLALGLVTFAEFLCAALLAVGLFSRMALVPLIVTMSVAAFVAHAADPFAKKEMALLYLAIYVTLYLPGPVIHKVT